MIDGDESTACWISLGSWQRDADPIQPTPIAFQFDFSLTDGWTTGWLEATASHPYVLWINGRLALRGPTRAFPADRFVDKLSLDGWLRPGWNTLSVVLVPPTGVLGYSYPTRSGFLCRGRVEGSPALDLASGSAWRSCEATWITSHRLLLSLAAGAQEHWDLSLMPENWPACDAQTWKTARILGGVGTPPWTNLRPNPISPLELKSVQPPLVWWGSDDRRAGNPSENLALSFPSDTMVASTKPPPTDEVLSNASENIFVWDLGKTRFFQPGVEILEAGTDTQIEWYYDIKLAESPTVMLGFETPKEGFSDSVKVNSAPKQWRSMQPRGGRFVTMRVAGTAACRFRPDIALLEYPFPHRAKFQSDHRWLEDVWTLAAESLRSCCTDAIVDTCARENNLWTFDACVAGKAIFHTFGDTALWRHSLVLIGNGIGPDGSPSAVVPAEPSFMCLFDQAFQWLISCEEYLLLTADHGLLRDISQSALRFLSLCERHLTTEHLFVPPPHSWHWVDWAPLDRRAYSLPINAALARASRAARSIGEAIQLPALVEVTHRISQRLEPALDCFWDEERCLYRDRVEPMVPTGAVNDFLSTPPDEALAYSLHGNLQMASLLPSEDSRRGDILTNIHPWLAEPTSPQAILGPGWIQQLLRPLVAAGHIHACLDFLREKYGPQLATGSPTLAEGFGAQLHNSAHAWGASVNSLIIENLIGLTSSRPKHFDITERIEGDFCYERETGEGILGLKRVDSQLSMELPEGYTAEHDGKLYTSGPSWQVLTS